MSTKEVMALIAGEQEYQSRLWPGPEHVHTDLEFLVFIQDYIREGLHNVSRFVPGDKTRAIVRKIAALALAHMGKRKPLTGKDSIDRTKTPSLTACLACLDRAASAGIKAALLEECTDVYFQFISEMAIRAMELHGAPARDIEGDLAKRVITE